MKTRLMLAGGLLLALTGCTTYDYVGGGRSGSYYHGAPSVEYRYPAGYPYNYGYPTTAAMAATTAAMATRTTRARSTARRTTTARRRAARQRWREPSAAAAAAVVQRRFAVAEHGLDAPPAAVEHPAVGAAPQARPAPAPSAPRMNGSPWRNMDRGTQRTVER
jgi:hypothetical protein